MKLLSIGLVATLAISVSAAPASAHDHFRGHGHGHHLGLIGALAGGVAAIVTAPFVIVGDIASGPHRYRNRDYDGDSRDDGYGDGYNRPPRRDYDDSRGAYAQQPQYGYPPPQNGYYAAQQSYYAPRYAAPGYGQSQYASQGYPPPQSYQGYNNQGPPPGYDPRDGDN